MSPAPIASAVLAALLAATATDSGRGTDPPVDAGEAWQFETLDVAAPWINPGPAATRIVSVIPDDPLAEATFPAAAIPPGGRGLVHIRQPVGLRLGRSRFGFVLETRATDESGEETPDLHRLVVEAFVQSAYDDERPSLDFGLVDRSRGKTMTVELASREVLRLAFEGVVAAPEFLSVAPPAEAPPGAPLVIAMTVSPDAPAGFQVGAIHIRTNVPRQPDYAIAFRALVYGDVYPSESPAGPVRLGAVPAGRPHVRRTRLASRSGRPFGLEPVGEPGPDVSVAARPCPSVPVTGTAGAATAACWVLEVRWTAPAAGPLQTTIPLEVTGNRERVPVTFAGVVVDADARIEPLGTLDAETDLRREHR